MFAHGRGDIATAGAPADTACFGIGIGTDVGTVLLLVWNGRLRRLRVQWCISMVRWIGSGTPLLHI
jgi:hypothetical protein